MKRIRALTMILATLAVAQPALAQLPDPVLFRLRMESGDIAQARRWLDAGLPPDFLGDVIGTGLMIAAREGNIPLMEVFVTHGADVNKANAVGEQALLHAAWRGQLDAVKWLLAHGARINRQPLSWTALHYAVFAGHEAVAQYLIEHGADINARSPNGSSVLMMAIYEGHEELARKLVSLGADLSIKNDRGDGALQWAMKFNRGSIARLVSERQQFAAPVSQPKEPSVEPVRSAPPVAPVVQAPAPPTEIDRLLGVRSVLAAKGMKNALKKVDRQIAALRARRQAVVLEISAARNAPRDQTVRLVTDSAAK